MEYREFTEKVQKKRLPKQSRIRNSWGIYDAYKLMRKNKWYDLERPLKEHEFYSIIRNVNKMLADAVANGEEIEFFHGMGKLELRKSKRGAGLIGNKLVVTYPINWVDTMRLWFEDEEAKNNKTLIRNESEYVYKVQYNKHDANYENQCFYSFMLNRFIKKALKENINKGKIDALW